MALTKCAMQWLHVGSGIAGVGSITAKLKWNWAGHVGGMQPEKWTNVITP